MYIEPSTNIKILKNVPLDKTYTNTLYFEDKTKQYNYFSGLIKHNLTDQTYQRVNKGVSRVGIKAEALYDCNYMMFQNASFGSKWFYAFITSVEYVNNVVSQINFELDVMQTWFYDCTLRDCFVEREHAEIDKVGMNLLPENVDLGPYVTAHTAQTGLFDRNDVVCAYVSDVNTNGKIINGVYTGLSYFRAHEDNNEQLATFNSILQGMIETNQIDSVVSIFMFPSELCKPDLKMAYPKVFAIDKRTTQLGNESTGYYVPTNQKLLTYPYNLLTVENGCGDVSTLRYEFFAPYENNTSKCGFMLVAYLSPTPEVMVVPFGYNGETTYYNEKITIKDFPQCAFAIDSYKAWLAQNAYKVPIQLGGALIGAIGRGDFLGASSAIGNVLQAELLPNQAKGNQGGSVMFAGGFLDFYFRNKTITPEYAKIIDDYFSMYGYATNENKVPNIHSRPHWNYVKTKTTNIIGSVPSDDLKTIKEIFQKGITFWKKGDEVGNYHLYNAPT